MPDMEIPDMWRSMRPVPTEAPRAGARQETAAADITISVTQQCQTALPLENFTADEVTATVTSNRPGVAGQVVIAANFNSANGSYQGPTTTVGQGQFTATDAEVATRFVVLLPAGWPVLGVGAVVNWEDGAPESAALTYEQLACNPWIWWQWLIRVLAVATRPFALRRKPAAPHRGREPARM
jgi:hypothetical protein